MAGTTRSFTIKSFSEPRAMRIIHIPRIIYAPKSGLPSIPVDIRGSRLYELEKAMNILRSLGKTTLPYSNESAGCSFEIMWTIAFATVIMICLYTPTHLSYKNN